MHIVGSIEYRSKEGGGGCMTREQPPYLRIDVPDGAFLVELVSAS